MKHLCSAIAAIGLLTATVGQASADVVLSGPDANDGSYSTAALAAIATPSDTVSSGGLTGISLWGLLGGANASSPTASTYGAITTSTPASDNGKNAILRYYLLATGTGGQQSVVSLGEIDPSFGGTAATPPLVAFQGAGGLLAAPQLLVPGAPGREVSNLTNLQLLAVPALPAGGGGQSTAVQLSGNVKSPGSYTLSNLQNDFTPAVENIAGDNYTGVPLFTFLDPSDSNSANQVVVTAGTDGYEVLLSLAELDPSLGGNPNDLLPYADTGTDFPTDGVARTILPTDNKHGRWESNLDAVAVTTVPEPGSATLVVLASAILGVVRLRPLRRR